MFFRKSTADRAAASTADAAVLDLTRTAPPKTPVKARSQMAFVPNGSKFLMIRAGSVFTKRREKISETAKVTGISTDGLGIQHIHYSAYVFSGHSNVNEVEQSRVLSVSRFIELYAS